MSRKFEFENKTKTLYIIMMVIGLLGMIWAFFWNDGFNSHARFWGNLLVNTYYFAGIAVTGVFFIAAHHLGYSGWQTVLKKIPMAMSKFLYVAFGLMIVITIAAVYMPEGSAFYSNLYAHWNSVHGKSNLIVQEKAAFLNPTMYTALIVIFFGLWAWFARKMYTNFMSIKNIKEYKRTLKISAAFLLVFGVSSSVLSWIVIMSIDPHWYSTLFGWYNLISYFVAGFSMMVLILIYLKGKGLMPHVYEDHIHDITKYIFGFSIFWAYLWISQYMLIWYANIPEATVWFHKRFDIPLFNFIFFATIILNFVAPILIIMKRKSKRNFKVVAFTAVMLIIGHYLDFYQLVMLEPMNVTHHSEQHEATEEHHSSNKDEAVLYAENHGESQSDVEAKEHHSEAKEHHATANLATIGFPEIMIFIGFLGMFLYITFTTLSKEEDLEVTEDPFLKESVNHHFDW